MRLPELGGRNSRSSASWTDMATTHRQLVLCLRNEGYEVSLERRKIYRVVPDRAAATRGLLRVIDFIPEEGHSSTATLPPWSGPSRG